ncbi:MAG: SusC/RagA family TonB-linked outer membrane protein [Chitinophagaceae bacterium]|nr:MAG: SusC/RagA family TonB-linked outer membrane protein [Chitinophagaceae bacterium]
MNFYFTGNSLHCLKSPSFKFLLVMKLTVVLLLAVCIQVSAKVEAQTVTYNKKNVSFEKALNEITGQTGYKVLYNSYIVGRVRKLYLSFDKTPLRQALDIMFKGAPLTYSMVGNIIVVRERTKVDQKDSASELLQLKEIHGTVVDASNRKPLIGVTIRLKGSSVGTTTDMNGKFSLNVSDNSVLQISFLGYTSEEIPVNGRNNIQIKLSASTTALNQLVVVAYGTVKKSDLTGSVAQVSGKTLEATPVFNIGDALIGRASGVQVLHNSAQPGSRIQINIRGGNSMIGDNEPLYIVDGFPVTGRIDFLNPSDIESINILKDASATAIYGARGANGVVIITTKTGKRVEGSHISIQSYYGIQRAAKTYKLLNARQYAIVANEWLTNSGQQPFFNLDEINNPGTNWQSVIFSPAPIQNHTITFSGSSAKSNYSVSGNYFKQKGIILNSGAQRGSFRLNLNHDIKSWLILSTFLDLSRSDVNSVPVNNGDRGNNVFSGALSAPPTASVYDTNGLPTRIQDAYPFTDPADLKNPLLWSKPYKNETLSNTILFNNALNFNLTKNLTFTERLGLEYDNSVVSTYTPIIYQGDKGSASSGSTFSNSFLNENLLTYNKDFDNDHIDLLGGFTYQNFNSRSTNISVSSFSNNLTQDFNLGAAQTDNPPSSGISQWKLASWLGRANYGVRDKYFITATARADGSSRFGKNNKWGFFPSGALAWRISQESFMKKIHFINELKLRVSYGIIGNTAISPYQSLSIISPVRYIYQGNSESIGYAPTSMANPDLKWETTNEGDIGLDLSILNGRLEFTFDYYNKKTHNLLASVPLPPSVGYGFVLENIGQIQNQGLEFSLNADILTQGVKWNIAAQLSTNKNKVLELAGGSDIVSSGVLSGLPGYNLARVGEPLGVFYGYLEDGLDNNGQIKYVDVNKDGRISPLDRVILGSPYPKLTFGFNSDLSYKNFDLSFFIQGTYGNDIFWRTAYTNLNSFQRGDNQLEALFGNYWTPQKPNLHAKYPKISPLTQMQPSDRFIKNGSYLRMKSIQLSYTIPFKRMKISWVNQVSIYVKANNLFTLTKYPGLDPEVNTMGTDSQDIGNRLVIGTDETGYPNARIFGAGIQLNF